MEVFSKSSGGKKVTGKRHKSKKYEQYYGEPYREKGPLPRKKAKGEQRDEFK